MDHFNNDTTDGAADADGELQCSFDLTSSGRALDIVQAEFLGVQTLSILG